MKNSNILLGFMFLGIFLNCSKSDDGPIAAPQVSYDQLVKAKFYTAGNSAAPQVNWNGDVGKFGLQQTIKSLSIDENTGVLSWSKLLPPGDHEIDVIAYNNSGATVVPINLENPLSGKFSGDLFPSVYVVGNTDFLLQFDFKEDGTLTGFTQNKNSEGDIEGPFEFFGSFTIEKDDVRGSFKYEEVADPIPFAGTLNQNNQKVLFVGRYHPDFVCQTGIMCASTFELEMLVE